MGFVLLRGLADALPQAASPCSRFVRCRPSRWCAVLAAVELEPVMPYSVALSYCHLLRSLSTSSGATFPRDLADARSYGLRRDRRVHAPVISNRQASRPRAPRSRPAPVERATCRGKDHFASSRCLSSPITRLHILVAEVQRHQWK